MRWLLRPGGEHRHRGRLRCRPGRLRGHLGARLLRRAFRLVGLLERGEHHPDQQVRQQVAGGDHVGHVVEDRPLGHLPPGLERVGDPVQRQQQEQRQHRLPHRPVPLREGVPEHHPAEHRVAVQQKHRDQQKTRQPGKTAPDPDEDHPQAREEPERPDDPGQPQQPQQRHVLPDAGQQRRHHDPQIEQVPPVPEEPAGRGQM